MNETINLTPQQLNITHLLCLGMTDKEIGCKLGYSAGWTQTLIRRIIEALNLQTRDQLVTWALRTGTVDVKWAYWQIQLRLAAHGYKERV